jgi:3D (Asp-Asp-Asp) domain-containing protein
MKVTAVFLGFLCLLQSCDEEEDADMEMAHGSPRPSKFDLLKGERLANILGASAASSESNGTAPMRAGDLSTLGGNANQNQQAFRQRFGLSDPSLEQLANWQEYDARLTAYSNKDRDWPFPTAASSNWLGSTWNGDPLAVEGTTVAVDFTRIPRGSLLYIPSLDMYAEANDTGATNQWAQSDSGLSDYDVNGAGRVDIYHFAGDRSPVEVERNFGTWIGKREFGQIFVVSSGTSWKKPGR